MVAVYRTSVLRIACAFRTILYDVVCVVAGMVPIELLADERSRIHRYERRDMGSDPVSITLEEKRWQRDSETSPKARWTHHLIPSIRKWVEREHEEVDYYLSQMLTGHGCCCAYQYCFRHDVASECSSASENTEHVLFACPRFSESREELARSLGLSPTPASIMDQMLSSKENWEAVASFAVF